MANKPNIGKIHGLFQSIDKAFFAIREAVKVSWIVNKKLLIIITVLGVVWGLTTIPNLYITKIILDTVIKGIATRDLNASLITIVGLITLQTVLTFFRSLTYRITSRSRWSLNRQVDDYLETTFALKFASLDLETISDPSFRNKYEKIRRESSNRIWSLVYLLVDFPRDITSILSAFVITLTVAPIMVPLVAIFVIPRVIFGMKITKTLYDLSEKFSADERLVSLIERILHNPKNELDQKLLGNSTLLANKVSKIKLVIRDAWLAIYLKNDLLGETIGLPSDTLSAVFNVWLYVQAIIGKITLGTAQMVANATQALDQSLSSFMQNFSTAYEHSVYLQDYLWLINLQPQMVRGQKKAPQRVTSGLELKNVWFKYPKSKNWILRGITMTIKPNDHIAIVGENGAGKTTLIKLICRLYQPTKGEILLNGVNIFDFEERSYWEKISALFQGFETYPFSVRETIGYGDIKHINHFSEIIEAAKQTGVDKFIESLPKKYDTPLAKDLQGGVEPSSGQWQRIGLARALFRKSIMIILDEPTSNVDPKAEEEIFERVIELTKNKILILISHRFSTVRKAGKIILIENGKLIEQGTHDDLIKANKSYAKLFNLQAKGYQ